MAKHRLLVVDDDADDLDSTKSFLEARDFLVETANSGRGALTLVEGNPTRFSVIILDYQMSEMDGAEVTRKLKAINPDLYILVFSGQPERSAFLLPLRNGATSFVDKGEGEEVFLRELGRLIKKYESEMVLTSDVSSNADGQKIIASIGLVGCSQGLVRVAEKVWNLQSKQGAVLLLGETGTGKELVARALHHNRSGAFLGKNCADYKMSKETARSELFGHVKGAFTGAISNVKGVFEEARGGTIFLDELHELDRDVQSALLRVLEEKTVTPLGSHRPMPIDCRLVAGAKPDLFELVASAVFKEDLFHRVSENIIKIPRLSQRREDIPLLVEHFCKMWSKENGVKKAFLANTMPLLESLPWPGNVRELKNVVFATLNETKKKSATKANVEKILEERASLPKKEKPKRSQLKEQVESLRRNSILNILSQSSSLSQAARTLNLAPSSISRFLKQQGIDFKQHVGKSRMNKGAPIS